MDGIRMGLDGGWDGMGWDRDGIGWRQTVLATSQFLLYDSTTNNGIVCLKGKNCE